MIRTRYTYVATINEYFEYCMELVALKGIEFKVKEERFCYQNLDPTDWNYRHLTPEELHALNIVEKSAHYRDYYTMVDDIKDTPNWFNREDDDYYDTEDIDFECEYRYDKVLKTEICVPIYDLDDSADISRYYRIRKTKWQRKYSLQLKDEFGIDLDFVELMSILTRLVLDYENSNGDFNIYITSDSIKRFKERCFYGQTENLALIDFWCSWCEGAARPIPLNRAAEYGYLHYNVENLLRSKRYLYEFPGGLRTYGRATFPIMDYFADFRSASEINCFIFEKIPFTTVRFTHSKLVLVCYTFLLIIEDRVRYVTIVNKYLAIFKFIEYLFGDLNLDIENFKFLTNLFFRCVQLDDRKSAEYGFQYYPYARLSGDIPDESIDEYGFSKEIVALLEEYINNSTNRFSLTSRASRLRSLVMTFNVFF